MDTRTQMYANALRLTALTLNLMKTETTATAAGRAPGPEFERVLHDTRTAAAELRAWASAQRMKQEVDRARARFLSRA